MTNPCEVDNWRWGARLKRTRVIAKCVLLFCLELVGPTLYSQTDTQSRHNILLLQLLSQSGTDITNFLCSQFAEPRSPESSSMRHLNAKIQVALIGTLTTYRLSSRFGQIIFTALCVGRFSQLHQNESTGEKYSTLNPEYCQTRQGSNVIFSRVTNSGR